jgi:hypothetical protein
MPSNGSPRIGTTRIFVLGVISIFALLVMHNALNIDLEDQASHGRRPHGRPGARPALEPASNAGLATRPELAVASERPVATGQPPALAAAAALVNEPPWATAIAQPRPFNYSDCTSRPGSLGPTRALEYIVSPDDADGFPANCEDENLKDLCDVVRRVAINREVLTAVCNSKIIGQLEMFLQVSAGAR